MRPLYFALAFFFLCLIPSPAQESSPTIDEAANDQALAMLEVQTVHTLIADYIDAEWDHYLTISLVDGILRDLDAIEGADDEDFAARVEHMTADFRHLQAMDKLSKEVNLI